MMIELDPTAQKSLLLFGLTTVSVYVLLKGLKRFYANHGKQGVLRLIIYPIKSVPGIEVEQLEITPTGVRFNDIHDRAFMLLNENNNIVSLRNKPSLALISPSLADDTILLDAPDMGTLKISTSSDLSANEIVNFKLWGQDIKGALVSEQANKWFTRYLKSDTKLVKFEPQSMSYRKTDIHTEKELLQDAKYPIIYQDECAISLANQSSIDDLNSRIGKKENHVTYRNFRPNILVRVGRAFCEDSWGDFAIGQVNFSLAKPCHRCTTTVAMPDRGEKNADFEPLQTLKSFRIKDEWKHLYQNSPLFGLSLYARNNGFVRFGDELVVGL